MVRLASILSALNAALALLAGILLVSLVGLTAVNVILRYFFGSAVFGAFDLLQAGVATVIFLAMPYCTWRDGHVAVDIAYNLFSKIVQRCVLAMSDLISGAVLGLLAYRSTTAMVSAFNYGERSSLLGIPFAPLWGFIALGAALGAVSCAGRLLLNATNNLHLIPGTSEEEIVQ
ncbi:TRAP-type C4-dicarboxylate transport system, small permease component [Pelagibacterium halotolerans]|uniref:TRAP transporter small permease protein n=1 Tax=Pelagibacterium halotolerans (strain DSM 22347 / JCM 15775 / CGMCC 1.7692 / B2) TaxID=1082931 RepID=G4RD73_PELHB|nr:TRAP dicarboxylate transporter, DctQ subunit, unknown substrate 3 [Pelagibacterium halotolerans B2]SEA81727.1 TRAP-type C4-dicarboxylate transport system, small permease component [Pelagibacterium halotolerans]